MDGDPELHNFDIIKINFGTVSLLQYITLQQTCTKFCINLVVLNIYFSYMNKKSTELFTKKTYTTTSKHIELKPKIFFVF